MPTPHPKCTCGHSRERHYDGGEHCTECSVFVSGAQQCPCPWYTPEDRSPQPARVGGREA